MTERTSPARVLVVDDDADVLATLERGLADAGFEVSVAASGNEAVGLLENRPGGFDVAVVDLVLPDAWGPQMAVAHSELQPELKVIYISGHDQDDAVLAATSSESRDVAFLSKPFSLEDLVSLIEERLAARS